MGGFFMKKMLRQAGYLIVIIMLLPYVVTIFVNGNGILKIQEAGNPYLVVKREGEMKEMTLDEYGIGVLAKEIDADAMIEALKAQAVLIRTSIYKTLQEEGTNTILEKSYWTRSQMQHNWGSANYSQNYSKLKEAWDETKGIVLFYEGKLALTPYHKLNNGKTRSGNEVFHSGSYAYLQVKECPGDLEEKSAVTTTIIQETGLEILELDSAGYVTKVKCGSEEVNGEEFRSTYHLASASFTLEDFEGNTKVTTKGVGHGIGMSQHTAKLMAKEGKNYKEILAFFFEGTTFEEVAEILVNPE